MSNDIIDKIQTGNYHYLTINRKLPQPIQLEEVYSNFNFFPKLFFANKEQSAHLAFGSLKIYTDKEDVNKINDDIKFLMQKTITSNETNLSFVPKLFGGFSFSNNTLGEDNHWQAFTNTFLFLPEFTLQSSDKETIFSISINIAGITNPVKVESIITEKISQFEHQLKSQIIKNNSNSNKKSINYELSKQTQYSTWESNIQTIKQNIQEGKCEKVVLSRYKEINLKNRPNPPTILKNLINNYPSCYTFYFEPERYHGFFGATPEVLVELSNRRFYTIALAGSIPRSQSISQDHQYKQYLLTSNKNLSEHDIVIQQINDKFKKMRTVNLDVSNTQVVKFKNIQHLQTEITGQLVDDLTILDLIDELHPTPAVGGSPSDYAIKLINDLETHQRGWYASPLGMIDINGDGIFVVGIRSGVINHNKVRIYAGAGIVGKSDPKLEWEETEIKFLPILSALGVIKNEDE